MLQSEIDELRRIAVAPQQHFIAGAPKPVVGGARLDVVSPIDGQRLTTIADGDAADVDAAVRAARRAFEESFVERAGIAS